MILDFNFPKDGPDVNNFVSKDIYLGEDVDLVYPRIDDSVSLIKYSRSLTKTFIIFIKFG